MVFSMNTAREFTIRLVDLLRNERNALAELILALSEFDRRELWKELGYPSLFPFLQRELGLSDGAAYYRMKAARLVRDFPEIVEPLRDGRLCVTNVVELSKVITAENRGEVLPRYFHVSKREAEAITVSILPKPIVPTRSVVTAVRAPPLALSTAVLAEPKRDAEVGTGVLQLVEDEPRLTRVSVGAPTTASPRPRADVEPLTKDLARLHLTVPPRLLEKLAAARDALSHVRPGATDAEVIEAALDALLAKAAKRKGLTDRPRKLPPVAKGDGIPAHVKRAVWARDGGCCQWAVKSGICGSTYQLEFDHRRARALGGPPTIENVRILCRRHNVVAARHTFGDAWMDKFQGKRDRPCGLKPVATLEIPGAS
jgi:hypothetical protein